MMGNAKRTVKFMSYNCRSIRNKTPDVMSLIENNDVDVALIQETWLRETDCSILYEIEELGYTLKSYRKPRKTELGGGIAFIFKNALKLVL